MAIEFHSCCSWIQLNGTVTNISLPTQHLGSGIPWIEPVHFNLVTVSNLLKTQAPVKSELPGKRARQRERLASSTIRRISCEADWGLCAGCNWTQRYSSVTWGTQNMKPDTLHLPNWLTNAEELFLAVQTTLHVFYYEREETLEVVDFKPVRLQNPYVV